MESAFGPYRDPVSLAVRVMAKIDRSGAHWIWIGARSNGAPVIQATTFDDRRIMLSVRRWVYEAFVGELAIRRVVFTTCGVDCLRPDHLRIAGDDTEPDAFAQRFWSKVWRGDG